MATRINTKFVITLASIIVLLVLSMVLAFTFLKKTAADHVELAEKAMQAADVALSQGDIKTHNSERQRAAKHFGSAKAKDANNTEYLYGFIEAHEKFICQNLTAAGNQLDSILAGAASIHDTPGATEQERSILYELLSERTRMQLFTDQHPIGVMLGYTTRRLDAVPEDPLATRYKALSLSYMAGQKTDDLAVEEDIQFLNDVAASAPDDAPLQSALARYHLGNARRLFRAKGGSIDDKVNASFGLAIKHVDQALQLAIDHPPAFVEAAEILFDLRIPDQEKLAVIDKLQRKNAVLLNQIVSNKANRQTLYLEEMTRAAGILMRAPISDGESSQNAGRERGIELATLLVQENPDEPAAYQFLGNLQREANNLEQASETIKSGMAIDRLADANQFIRDHRARLAMQGMLADIKCKLALRADGNDERAELLKSANEIIDELSKADTLRSQGQWLEARVNFLRGQVMLSGNKPRQAIDFLDRANQAYASKDAATLRLLAQTHSRLGNDKLVPGFYETIIQNKLNPTTDDLLNLINLYINPGEGQQLEKAQAQLQQYRKLIPNDIRGVRLQARLLTIQKKFDDAITLLEAQDLEKNPDLMDMIVGIQAARGETSGALELLRKRIADRAEGEPIGIQLVSRLLMLIPRPAEKAAELDRLVSQGLDPEIAAIFKRTLSSGQTSLEDELALIDIQGGSDADKAMRRFLLYQRRGKNEQARQQLDKVIELEPKRADVIEWRFRFALADEDWPAAEQAVKDMLTLDPDQRTELAVADGQFMQAQILAIQSNTMQEGEARNKRIREAIVAYNKALDTYSHYVDGWIQLGRLHYIQSNFFAAQDSLREALDRQSRNIDALELMGLAEQSGGDQVNALERFQQILEIQPGNRSALARFTNLAQQIGQVARAIRLREQIRERVPTNYDNRRVLAVLYAQGDQKAKAVQTVQEVIEAEGRTRQNIATLSQVLATNGSHERAQRELLGYLAELGEQAQWQDYLLLAQAHENLKKTADADQAFAQAIAMEKPEGTFSAALAKAQALLTRGEPEKAAAIFEELAQAFPDNDAIKQQAAELFLSLRNFDKADVFTKRLPQSPQRYRLLIQSASAQQGKLGAAIEIAKQAASTYPSDFGLRLILLELLRSEQDRMAQHQRSYTKLLSMAKALSKDHPDRVEAKVSLADVLLRMDRTEQATATLEKALEFAPRNLATNQRLYNIKLQQARSLVSAQPKVSQEKAREALAIVSVLIESQPNIPALLRGAGQAAELAGLSAASVDFYKRAFEASNTPGDLASYAASLLNVGRGAAARTALEGDNATLVSNSLYLRALRGRAIAATGRPDTATTLFTNLLQQVKEPVDQLTVTQQVVQSFADINQAIEVIEKALGEDLPIEIDSALVSLLLGQGRYKDAATRLEKYVTKPEADAPTQFTLLSQLALAYQESGQLTEAKDIYDLAYKKMSEVTDQIQDSRKVQFLNNLAYLLADQTWGYEDQAIQYAKQALDLMPENAGDQQYAVIQDTLGWAYFKAGKFEDAIRVLKDSVRRFPLASNQLHLGRAYLATNDPSNKDRAVLVLRNALNQAKAQGDEKLIAEVQKWYDQSL